MKNSFFLFLMIFEIYFSSLIVNTYKVFAATEIYPPHIYMTAEKPSGEVTITNHRDIAVGYEITSFSWEQKVNGEISLIPSKNIHTEPSMIKLGPNESGDIKINVKLNNLLSKEETFRVLIRELPDHQKQEDEHILVLATISMPVFVQPEFVTVKGKIDILSLTNGQLAFAIINAGTAHFLINDISVIGTDKHKNTVFQINRNGWYILAEGRQVFEATVSQKDCRKSKSLVIRAQLLNGGLLEAPVELHGRSCGTEASSHFPPPTLNGVPLKPAPPLPKS